MNPRTVQLLSDFKIPYQLGFSDYTWDGSNLWIDPSEHLSWFCHEVAHIVLSKHLTVPEHGLGPDPGAYRRAKIPAPFIVPHELLQWEEDLACLGGLCLLTHYGTLKESQNHAWHYGMVYFDETEFQSVWEALKLRAPRLSNQSSPKEILSLLDL